MSRFLSDFAARLDPYVYGEQPKDRKYIKLNTNENPYGVSPAALEAINHTAPGLARYPDPEVSGLREAVAEYYNESLNLEGDLRLGKANVFAGNGSDEVLAFIFPAFLKGGITAVSNISYSFYPVYASLFEVALQTIPLNEDFTVNLSAYAKGALPEDVNAILLCNPNAPTSLALPRSEVQKIVEANPDRLVIVDEAYVDFGGETMAGLVNAYDNLLVVQTFSKSRSLAGIRLGMAIGSPELIEGIDRIKNCFNSYSVDLLAQAAGTAAIKDVEFFEQTRNAIIATRERIGRELEALGFVVPPSKTNFFFAKHPDMAGEDLFLKLREKGVLVRFFNKPLLKDYLRISIGTDEEMDGLVAAAKEILGK